MAQLLARNEPLFGVSVEPLAERADEIFEVARIADMHEQDLLAVQDHPYLANYLDAWTLLVALATSTNHISVMPNVINLPLRTPAMVAKGAATLSLLAGGRVELGVGGGDFCGRYRGLWRSTPHTWRERRCLRRSGQSYACALGS